MANVFRSKEVYKHLKYDLHDRNEMVPVQGVYISGEYRPPYYNDPCIHIYEISSQNAKVDSFQDIDATSGEDALVKIIDFSVSTSPITITDYTTASTDTGEDSLVKILDFWVQMEQPYLDFYESKNQNAGEDYPTTNSVSNTKIAIDTGANAPVVVDHIRKCTNRKLHIMRKECI